jgi:hypothetical protein
MIDELAIRQRWEAIGSKLDERGRRLFAACEVRSAGWGGLALVSKITELARSTINRGEDDLDAEPFAKGRVRRVGGGRWAMSETDSGLVPALKRLVDPATQSRRSPTVCGRLTASALCGRNGSSTPGPSRRSCARS